MTTGNRRNFLRSAVRAAGAAATLATVPLSIRQALAIPARKDKGTIQDVQHVVILMQENRSFDHYFGTMKGVRGFGDSHPIPLATGKPVWHQSDGKRVIPPYHLDTRTTSAIRVPGTPHSFSDSQAAWNQGKFGEWPRFKTPFSMGYYERTDIPFQFALAEAFTLCDAYHCSITTGTDPNRIVFWSGSNFDPEVRARGENCTDADSEPNNLRCWIKGALPDPGYTYQGSAFKWPTIPDVLEKAGISWRFYQDPNNNWTGAMHGCLAFESFREAAIGSPIYKKGMMHWSLEEFALDVKHGRLPQVSWVLPPALWSEHPSASSPLQGAEFTARVLNALTANPEVWSKTVFLITFDENDGQFDHVPPPAVPSYDLDGSLAGKSTVDLKGEYFSDPSGKYIDPADTVSGRVRPWGLGPRVPMYVISPWSKGGWVNSEVLDHTSIGRFLERRFNIGIPGISPWHRAVCGDLTSAFDFANPGNSNGPTLPNVTGSTGIVAVHSRRPRPNPPDTPSAPAQEPGTRPSRALPYQLHAEMAGSSADGVTLTFRNIGQQGAVFHVYDKLHLDRIPRRYTVELSKTLTDAWETRRDGGNYDLEVHGPGGFFREFRGSATGNHSRVNASIGYDTADRVVVLRIKNDGDAACRVLVSSNAYRIGPALEIAIENGGEAEHWWPVADSGNWYDLSVTSSQDPHYLRRFTGRMETGADSISDPAMGGGLSEETIT